MYCVRDFDSITALPCGMQQQYIYQNSCASARQAASTYIATRCIYRHHLPLTVAVVEVCGCIEWFESTDFSKPHVVYHHVKHHIHATCRTSHGCLVTSRNCWSKSNASEFDSCVSNNTGANGDWFDIAHIEDEFALSRPLLQGFHSIRSGECNCDCMLVRTWCALCILFAAVVISLSLECIRAT